jgi:hypothetical protein
METIKKENQSILNSEISIFWWNFGKKTLSFKGTVNDFLKKEKVNLTIKYFKDEIFHFEKCSIDVEFSCGGLQNITYKCTCMEDAVRMVLNIKLSYLGDKSQFTFKGRTRTINF